MMTNGDRRRKRKQLRAALQSGRCKTRTLIASPDGQCQYCDKNSCYIVLGVETCYSCGMELIGHPGNHATA